MRQLGVKRGPPRGSKGLVEGLCKDLAKLVLEVEGLIAIYTERPTAERGVRPNEVIVKKKRQKRRHKSGDLMEPPHLH
jgi:hypothetical protein